MYSLDLSRFTLDEFENTLRTVELLPGRRKLLDGLDSTMAALKAMGVQNLSELQTLLKKKKDYDQIAARLRVDPEIVTLLNREINSYCSKAYPLRQLLIFTGPELQSLAAHGIKTTLDLYDRCAGARDRSRLAAAIPMVESTLLQGLSYADLLRIGGVGPIYARMLRDIGIRSAKEYSDLANEEILRRFEDKGGTPDKPAVKLGLKDVEYCRRFIGKLDHDIEW